MIRDITRVWGKRIREESFGLRFSEVDAGTAESRTLSAGAVDDQPDADGLSALLSHDNDVLPDSLAARQDQAASLCIGIFAARLTSGRLPGRKLIPTSAGEITLSHSRSRSLSATCPQTRASTSCARGGARTGKIAGCANRPEHKLPFQQSAGLAEHRQRIVVDATKRRFSQKLLDPA